LDLARSRTFCPFMFIFSLSSRVFGRLPLTKLSLNDSFRLGLSRLLLRFYINLFELLLLLSPFLLLCSLSYDDDYVFLILPLLLLLLFLFSRNDPPVDDDDDFLSPTELEVSRVVKPCLPDKVFEL